jgi:hypothetical protein
MFQRLKLLKRFLRSNTMSEGSKNSAVIVAVIAAVASIAAAVVSYLGSRSLSEVQEEFTLARESAQFLTKQIDAFYVPMSMNLVVTKGLFDRYLEPKVSESEKEAIEHLMREHNAAMRTLLMKSARYLEPEAPEAVSKELLEHLAQWETVYQLKYQYKAYNGWLFAGIKEFGYRGFPRNVPGYQSINDYYETATLRLRKKLHVRFAGDDK